MITKHVYKIMDYCAIIQINMLGAIFIIIAIHAQL